MDQEEFPNFAEWKEQFKTSTKNEHPVEMSNQQLLEAYIEEKEGFDEIKKSKIK